MEDNEIIDLYWDRDETAISHTQQKYGAYCTKIANNILYEKEDSLPNSGISIMYGQSLIIQDKMNGFDTDGYMPDIITRGDALDAAVALLK